MCSRGVPGSCDCGYPLLVDVLNTEQICTAKCIRCHEQWVDQCPNSDNSPSNAVEWSAGALGHDTCPCLFLEMPGLHVATFVQGKLWRWWRLQKVCGSNLLGAWPSEADRHRSRAPCSWDDFRMIFIYFLYIYRHIGLDIFQAWIVDIRIVIVPFECHTPSGHALASKGLLHGLSVGTHKYVNVYITVYQSIYLPYLISLIYLRHLIYLLNLYKYILSIQLPTHPTWFSPVSPSHQGLHDHDHGGIWLEAQNWCTAGTPIATVASATV